MPVADPDWSPLPEQLFGDPPVDVAPLYVPTENHVVVSVYQTERYMSDGHPIPQIAVDFAIPGYPGTFTRRIANYRFDQGLALTFLEDRALQIKEIYRL